MLGAGLSLFQLAVRRLSKAGSGPPPLPTPTSDMLPALVTPGASYRAVFSPSRLLASYAGPLMYAGPTDGSALGDYGTGKQDIVASDLPGGAISVHGIYDQSGSGNVPQQSNLAQKPRIRAGVNVGGRLSMVFFGKPYSGTVSTIAGAMAGLTAAQRTEVFVLDATVAMQTGVLSEHYTDAGMTNVTRDFFTSPSAMTAVNAARTQIGHLPSSPSVIILVETVGGAIMYVNGTKLLGPVADPQAPDDVVATMRLGSSNYGNQYNANMRLAAYAAISGSIGDADAAAITSAMQARFGFFANHTLNLVHVGDSIVEGVNETDTMGLKHFMVPLLNAKTQYWNLGYAGKSMAACYADRTKFEGRLVEAGKANVLLIDAGVNDIGTDSRTGSSLYVDIATPYVAWAKGLGYTVGLVTILPQNSTNYPSTPSATMEQERQSYNSLVRANSAGADLILDRASEPHIGPLAAADDTTLYGADKIHPTTLGYSYLAPVYASAINSVL